MYGLGSQAGAGVFVVHRELHRQCRLFRAGESAIGEGLVSPMGAILGRLCCGTELPADAATQARLFIQTRSHGDSDGGPCVDAIPLSAKIPRQAPAGEQLLPSAAPACRFDRLGRGLVESGGEGVAAELQVEAISSAGLLSGCAATSAASVTWARSLRGVADVAGGRALSVTCSKSACGSTSSSPASMRGSTIAAGWAGCAAGAPVAARSPRREDDLHRQGRVAARRAGPAPCSRCRAAGP